MVLVESKSVVAMAAECILLRLGLANSLLANSLIAKTTDPDYWRNRVEQLPLGTRVQ